ncbi:DNA replication ATP-dependent helicase Dna2 [Exophiala aquamarina CBS 119918]|uniref:DNA replication ATP-dependent helicase/nuclease n=1 Tax=Exophiala aquamarina CBS 119918 TaxID=1182545 RepID=A0A072P0X7_9EURO|nr:DNA replication ATP-dependent helicase Dna2 [Exophiala aquamarina CBS 119918]KEF53322.1 DNA replication ATP-dependent helicase Dna2 [Exophiala aquamarina CBS 119918]
MPSAPFAVSSQASKKLKSFKSSEKLVGAEEDKENQQLEGKSPTSEDVSLSRPILSEASFPHTPAVRIPIEDLIANTEDAFNCTPPSTTPKDHVTWQTYPDSSDASGTARSTQRSRKRARSSSPASSQLGASEHSPAPRDPMNLDSLNKSLRTPNNDPTQDLWNRYSAANAITTVQAEPTLPQYAHLLPSSPQTPSTTGKDSGLRRTHSCGVEWPTSKAKKRKFEATDSHGRTKEFFAASRKDILGRDLSNNTRVGLLLDKIQRSLIKKPAAEHSPSSSSPLPDRRSQTLHSPTRPQSRARPRTARAPSAAVDAQRESLERIDAQPDESFSSEFSDDGLDIEAFESVEFAIAQQSEQQETSQTKAGEGMADPPSASNHHAPTTNATCASQGIRPGGQHEPGALSGAPPTHVQRCVAPKEDEFDDEFDDDEELMNGILDLAAKYESQQQPTTNVESVTLDHSSCQKRPEREPLGRLESLDEFENAFDDDDELWDNIAEATPAGESSNAGLTKHTIWDSIDNRAIKRYLIVDVFESHYEYKVGHTRPEKMLSVKDEKTGMRYIISLRDSWYDTRCTKGSYVHVVGKFDRTGQCVINDADNMIIIHPDHLISSTVVGDAFTCMRRAVLQDRVKATSAATTPQVYGYILHEVFGQALSLNKWDPSSLRDIIDRILPSFLESLYEIGVRTQDATEYLLSKTPEMMAWASVFVSDDFTGDSVIRDRNGVLVPTNINKVLELEEHIWSPMYGLKGNIDATVQAQMKLPNEADSRTLVVPLELKTGKRDNVEQHRVQTALYTLLLTDRYDINVASGVLYYMETSKTFRVEGIRNEIRHMVIERNELACYVHDKLALPPMIKKEHMCKSCYSKAACFTYHKLSENGDGETSGLGEKFNESTGHLLPAHQVFFKKWDDLLTKEERDTMKFRRELWTMLSSEREAVGRCFSEVVILPGSIIENRENAKINRFEYTFVKHKPKAGFSFTESQITIGEPIVISDEKGHFNFAAGYVTNVRPNRVVVSVDRRLQYRRRKKVDFDPSTNQVFSGTLGADYSPSSFSIDTESPTLYRIDKDEFANGMATARNNIIRIMEKDLWQARELRQLIVENKAPEFKISPTAYTLTGPASQQSLNTDQRKAIEKVMSAKDYALVLGMPGTGKTTTIAHIIRALVSQGKSVLLASYTHTAVDNILLKIKNDKIPTFRIGAINKVHPDIQSFADVSGIPKRSLEDLHASWQGSQVVATTCLGVNHGIFNARTFDYCIVDEASQITLPVCLGPIRMARTFILVGDHYQLPPLVQNKEAQEGGLDVSLFKLLSDAQPDSVVNLEHQYRMAEDIMLLSKELVYSGRIKCGNEAVAKRSLEIPDLDGGLAMHHITASSLPRSSSSTNVCVSGSTCWLRKSLAPDARCLFLDTDSITFLGAKLETAAGPRITNSTESALTTQLVTALIHSGVAPRNIGVITFYRSQLALLRSDIKASAGSSAASEVEMHTADKYQGRDKEVVILSCVRSNENNHVGDLLKDWRRVNVAVTRARSKLLVIGSKSTLAGSGVPILQGLTKIMGEKGWILDLPTGVIESHSFEGVTQATGATQLSLAGHGEKPRPTLEARGTRHSQGRNRPLQATSGNTTQSLNKRSPEDPRNGSVRKPNVIARGNKIRNVQKLLRHDSVMRDVLNELDLGIDENTPHATNGKEKVESEIELDGGFEPADFGVF